MVVGAVGSGLRPEGSGRLRSRSAWGHSRAAGTSKRVQRAQHASVWIRVGKWVSSWWLLAPLHPSHADMFVYLSLA